jgi:hypothetical protein
MTGPMAVVSASSQGEELAVERSEVIYLSLNQDKNSTIQS